MQEIKWVRLLAYVTGLVNQFAASASVQQRLVAATIYANRGVKSRGTGSA